MYKFKPLSSEDFKVLFEWLQTPHVQKWWSSESDWNKFELHYKEMILDPLVFPHIVFRNKIPIGYINYWFVEDDHNFKPHFPVDTVGTDQFIGVAELIGKGIGPEFIRQFTDQLLTRSNINLVITDPDPRNLSAIRAYEKAGFTKTKLMKTAEGEVQILEKC